MLNIIFIINKRHLRDSVAVPVYLIKAEQVVEVHIGFYTPRGLTSLSFVWQVHLKVPTLLFVSSGSILPKSAAAF